MEPRVLGRTARANSWWLVWELFIHVTVGTALFGLVAGPAVLLRIAVRWLQQQELGVVLVMGFTIAEHVLFGLDLLLFFVFLARTTARAYTRL